MSDIGFRENYRLYLPSVYKLSQIFFDHVLRHGLQSTLSRIPEAISCLNARAYMEASRALAMPCAAQLKKYHPRIHFKYFGHYLSTAFNTQTRASILANHYQFLNERVSDKFMSMICTGDILLWSESMEIGDVHITLTYPADGCNGYKEGELALRLWHESRLVFTLSFAIAPGFIFGIPDTQVIYIARLQGARTGNQLVRDIARSLHEVSPPALLLAATQGIASALGLQDIVGINACTQICLKDCNPGSHAYSVYDEFWMSSGALKLESGMYHLAGGAVEKPLSDIKSNHRSRTRRKRQFKQFVMQQVALTFRESCLASPQFPASLPVSPTCH